MGDSHNFAALDWVIEEIDSTLKQAAQALEAFVSDPEDSTRIRFCLTHLHQVHGSLAMVEFKSAANLASEMELLSQALMTGACANSEDAHQILMQAILQLPIYLDQIKTSRLENPLLIQSLLNDLRVVRGEELVGNDVAATIDLAPAKIVKGERVSAANNSQQFVAVVEKLRQMYQVAANGLIRGVKLEENTAYLHKAFSRLYKLTQGSARQAIWDISLALLEGVAKDSIEHSVSVKTLLKELHKELKRYVVRGNAELDTPADEELLTHLLYYVAGASSEGAHLNRIKSLYQLDNVIPKGVDLASLVLQSSLSPDLDALRSVVAALKEELHSVKTLLESPELEQNPSETLSRITPILSRIADTMVVIDVEELRQTVLAQVQELETLSVDSEVPSSQTLLNVAGKIISVEASLDALVGITARQGEEPPTPTEGHVELAHESVLRESSMGIEQAKDAIVEYISSQYDARQLENVPRLLNEVRGGLGLMQLSRPAGIIGACANFVENSLVEGGDKPEWSRLELLADAMSGVEYYLDNYRVDPKNADDDLLSHAEESLYKLGFDLRGEADSKEASAPEELLELDIQDSSDTSSEVLLETTTDVTNEAVSVDDEAPASEGEDSTAELSDSEVVEPENIALEIATAVAPDEVSSPVEKEELSSDIDEEIIEIFIEEAAEVNDTITEYLPRWAENLNDGDSLSEVRRAFHTVKGSGRMVGALQAAELAWVAENLLNRVIDGGAERNALTVEYVRQVHELMPELIQAFNDRRTDCQIERTQELQAWGESLANGVVPEALLASLATDHEHAPELESAVVEDLEEADELSEEDENDRVLWEIFSTEAEAHLETIEEFIHEMDEAAPLYLPPSDATQRALHTLKGSAHMAGVTPIAELATPLELFAKELRTYQVDVNADILQLLRDGVSYTRVGLEQLLGEQTVELPRLAQFVARLAELKELSVGHLIRQQEAAENNNKSVDPHLLSIFMAEEMNLLLDADELIDRWQQAPANLEIFKPLVAELATLEQGAVQANLPEMAGLASQLQGIYDATEQGLLGADEGLFPILKSGHNALLDMVDAVAAGQNIRPIDPDLAKSLNNLLAIPELNNGLLSEADTLAEAEALAEAETLALAAAESLAKAEADAEAKMFAELEAKAELEAQELADLEARAELEAQALAEAEAKAEVEALELAEAEAKAALKAQELAEAEAKAALEAQELAEAEAKAAFEAQELADLEAKAKAELEAQELAARNARLEAEALAASENTNSQDEEKEHKLVDDENDIDPEILEIFSEEADELLDDIDQSIHNWQSDRSNIESVEELKRALHTLKGGARLAGLMGFGELAHSFESYLIEQGSGADINDTFFTSVHAYQDLLLNSTDKIKSDKMGAEELLAENAPQIDAPSEPVSLTSVPSQKPADEPEPLEAPKTVNKGAEILPFSPKAKEPTLSPTPAPSLNTGDVNVPHSPAAAAIASQRSTPQEVVKVSAELLEDLVNLAGETSISRGRMEEQVSELSYSIEEMDMTINRLQEQLRRLDIETEAQMVFRQEQLAEHEDFDPLEMDRYSMLQQLSRSLTESASDLMDLKSTLLDKTRDTETLLLQQSRINTDLQEGLMRSRMVPFSRLVPRLRRIVRQISGELNKSVHFNLENVEGELDRSMLERMVAPLEHMLRNAVDHGIESSDERRAASKADLGQVTLSLGREGADVLIRLQDDGRGIDLTKVRAKAVERGLINEHTALTDHEVMQFILHPGFSTAEKVTQISGRGVGMDVVHSEIKQMGGNMQIVSQQGVGTEFVVRLPFTVSVNRALMVQIGDDRFAVPLNSIEGIVRVSPFELEHYYEDRDARFEYAGQNYQVRYLGEMLNTGANPKLEGQVLPIPVVLVRSAEHAVALQVDSLMGSREIVVKTLGSQFSNVAGLSGATVMGDGSVVVILDPHAMVRQELVRLESDKGDDAQALLARQEVSTPTILVVDDSVTVRKVTTRFLEREGYIVHTAKDGVDALSQLQDLQPDLMLLDIEMPRMDGFEVAKNVRSSQRLKDLPIIMITSRTGDKHREHAFSLGVNNYLGKPYQEEVLVTAIKDLLGDDETEA